MCEFLMVKGPSQEDSSINNPTIVMGPFIWKLSLLFVCLDS